MMRLVACVVTVTCLVLPLHALASGWTPPREEGAHEAGENHDSHPNLMGFRMGQLSVWEKDERGDREYRSFALAGVSYERTLIHQWLEIEISVPVAWSPGDEPVVVMPMDLHLKLPIHPSPDWSPYVAAGPTVDVEITPESNVAFGLSVAVGTYYWFSRTFGIDLEGDYNVVFDDGNAVHELLFAAGPVWRF